MPLTAVQAWIVPGLGSSLSGSLFDLPFDDPTPLEDPPSPNELSPLNDLLSPEDPLSLEGSLSLEGLGLGTDKKTTAKKIDATMMTKLRP